MEMVGTSPRARRNRVRPADTSNRAAAEAPAPSPAPGAPRPYARWAGRRSATLALILAVTLARILYLAFICPYTLVEDEAHYWEWSRYLDWSYYSKGPGIAWAIAASTALGRALGLPESEFWIRLPAALSGGILLFATAGLARSVTNDGRAAFLAVVALLLMPAFQVISLLMTIDAPYAACWALAAWAAFLALRRGSGPAWAGLGAALAIGFLFKYTILLLIPGIALYALCVRRETRLHPRWPLWSAVAAALFALGLIPVLIWNAQHDWPTVRHLLGHLGLAGGDTAVRQGGGNGWRWSPDWLISYLGAQAALIGPMLAFIAWSAHRSVKSRRAPSTVQPSAQPTPAAMWSDLSYLLCCAAPILVFYLLVAFVTEPEGNWPLAGYISLAALAGWGVLEAQGQFQRLASSGKLKRRLLLGSAATPARLIWRTSIVFGIVIALASIRIDLLARSLPMRWIESGLRSAGLYTSDRPIIPVGRLMGARLVSLDAARLRDRVASETGREPIVIAQHYGRASQLAYYMPGRPQIYCSSSRSDGRATQYDLWPHADLDHPDLKGRDAICIGGHLYQWEPAFDRTIEHGMLEGEPKASRLTFIGYGYRGFPK